MLTKIGRRVVEVPLHNSPDAMDEPSADAALRRRHFNSPFGLLHKLHSAALVDRFTPASAGRSALRAIAACGNFLGGDERELCRRKDMQHAIGILDDVATRLAVEFVESRDDATEAIVAGNPGDTVDPARPRWNVA